MTAERDLREQDRRERDQLTFERTQMRRYRLRFTAIGLALIGVLSAVGVAATEHVVTALCFLPWLGGCALMFDLARWMPGPFLGAGAVAPPARTYAKAAGLLLMALAGVAVSVWLASRSTA